MGLLLETIKDIINGTKYEENLESFSSRHFEGRRIFYVTNIDKNFESHDFFYENERLTINEFNYIISRYSCNILSIQSNYRSDECIVIEVDFDGEKYNDNSVLSGSKQSFSRKDNSNSDDLTMEDEYQICTKKLYCVSVKSKDFDRHDLYWNKQCVTIPEINHILANHTASVDKIIPVYKTGTEFFVLVHFEDKEIPNIVLKEENREFLTPFEILFSKKNKQAEDKIELPINHDQIFCLTSLNKNDMSRELFDDYNFITNSKYNKFMSRYNISIKSKHIIDHKLSHEFEKSDFILIVSHIN